MKLTFKIAFVFFFTLMGSCASDQQHVKGKPTIDDQSRVIYILDGKRASEPELNQGFEKGNIEVRMFANNSRDALLQFGEKYRYGIYIMVTKKKGGDQ